MAIITGTAASETITGTNLGDELFGLAGSDLLIGGDGDDVLDGGEGSDMLRGGAGDDLYIVTDSDYVDEAAGEGVDTVRTALGSYWLGWNVENLFGTSSGYQNLAGNRLDNIIQGGSGQNNISGDGGDDTILMSTGYDVVSGGDGNDTYVIAGASTDYVISCFNSQFFIREAGPNGSGVAYLRSVEDVRFEADHVTLTLIDFFSRTGTAGDDTLVGDDNDNMIYGLAGNDILIGGGGYDILFGGAGADRMEGGAGDDYYFVDDAGDVIVEGQNGGFDIVEFTTAYFNAGTASIEEIDAVDNGGVTIIGSDGYNIISGARGNDWIEAKAGNDYLYGDDGNDHLDGGAGADKMFGGAGHDEYIVDNSNDLITELVGEGTDSLYLYAPYFDLGEAEIEHIYVMLADDTTVLGSDSANRFYGGIGNDWFEGRGGDDLLQGGYGSDHLDGGDGNDELDGDLGNDVMIGGAGDDVYWVNTYADVVTELAGGGIDTVRLKLRSYTLPDFVENADTRYITGSIDVTGNDLANTFFMGSGAIYVSGGAGIDTVVYSGPGAVTVDLITRVNAGAAGDDYLISIENVTTGDGNDTIGGSYGVNILDGGLGADTMTGRLGSDIYYVDNAGDVVIEGAGGGNDEVRVRGLAVYALTAEVEKLSNATDAAFEGYGNSLDNLITGGAGVDRLHGGDGYDTLGGGDGDDYLFGDGGRDVLDGGAGADTMDGGDFDDMYFVDDSGDVIIERPGEGWDLVFTNLTTYQLTDWVENVTFTGSEDFTGLGNFLGNVMTGGTGNDLLQGFGGFDTLNGGGGDDLLLGGDAQDQLDGGAGVDVLVGGDDADTFIFSNACDSGTGAAADRIEDFFHIFERIDLRGVDANTLSSGDQAFSFIGNADFSGAAGQLRWAFDGVDTWLQGDTNGDGVSDFEVVLTGQVTLTAIDFYL
jgi:Ca2+-binding RTX toxin-like protein